MFSPDVTLKSSVYIGHFPPNQWFASQDMNHTDQTTVDFTYYVQHLTMKFDFILRFNIPFITSLLEESPVCHVYCLLSTSHTHRLVFDSKIHIK